MNTKPRRILIFSLTYYPTFVGGAEVAVKEITDRISSDDIIFDMITIGDGRMKAQGSIINDQAERISNVNVYRVLSGIGLVQKLLFPFVAYRKALQLQAEHGYHAVWAIMASYGGFAAHLFKHKNPHIPFLLTIQEGDHFERRAGVLKHLFKKIFKSADAIQAISNYLAEWSTSMGATCPIDVIPNAVDMNLFTKTLSLEERTRLCKSINKKDDDIILIHTGRLVEKNAVADIVSALQYLPEQIRLLQVGSGVLIEDLKILVSDLKLESRVTFVDYVPHDKMVSYLKVADIFIRPSLTEGLGNSFLEAMAAGIPVIATPVGGIPDFLIDGETGLFCEVHNPKSIAQKVEKLIKDKESREYIVGRARAMVEKKYQWESVVEKMKVIFDSM